MLQQKQLINYVLYLIITSSTIILNKWLYIKENTPILTLTLVQFMSVFIGLQIYEKLNYFSIKSVHLDLIIIPAVLFCSLVTFMNLSLSYNSLGTYQISKTVVTPIIILLQFILYKHKCSLSVYTSLTFILCGSILVFYNDSSLNVTGCTFLTTAIFVTVLYEIILNHKQSELQINKLQLLYYYAPFSSILLGFSLPIFEPPFETFGRNWTFLQLVLVFFSCLLSFFNNIVTNTVTGNNTLLNYTILIQLKFLVVLVGNWLIFGDILNQNQIIGIGLNIFGCLSYSFIKGQEMKKYQLYKRII